jgi:hypothetical protein
MDENCRKMELQLVNVSTPVPTSKPRINSNIDPQLFELLCFFITLRRGKNISYSQSKAIEECCNAFLSLGKERIEKICRLADADRRSPGDYAQLLLKQALDEIEEPK